jgi:GDP-L-fucose synthase
MNREDKIYVAGHRGLVGSAIVRHLKSRGFSNILVRTSGQLDLRRQEPVERFFRHEKPDYVFLAAARVGGILANSMRPADFIYDNTMIAFNVIRSAYTAGVKKLLNLGSSCIYPKLAPQPLKEEYLLSGKLEPTNEAYAVAKISAIKLCRYYNEQHGTDYLSAMPPNLYGPNDNFDLKTSHVLQALIRKIHEANERGTPVTVWGDGTPLREFLYVEDLADGLLSLMQYHGRYEIGELINIGAGEEITVKDLACLIAETLGYSGSFRWDLEKPNGTPRKLLDVSKMREIGWTHKTSLKEGIQKTYEWFCANIAGK